MEFFHILKAIVISLILVSHVVSDNSHHENFIKVDPMIVVRLNTDAVIPCTSTSENTTVDKNTKYRFFTYEYGDTNQIRIELLSNDKYTVKDSSLLIHQFQYNDVGWYECDIINEDANETVKIPVEGIFTSCDFNTDFCDFEKDESVNWLRRFTPMDNTKRPDLHDLCSKTFVNKIIGNDSKPSYYIYIEAEPDKVMRDPTPYLRSPLFPVLEHECGLYLKVQFETYSNDTFWIKHTNPTSFNGGKQISTAFHGPMPRFLEFTAKPNPPSKKYDDNIYFVLDKIEIRIARDAWVKGDIFMKGTGVCNSTDETESPIHDESTTTESKTTGQTADDTEIMTTESPKVGTETKTTESTIGGTETKTTESTTGGTETKTSESKIVDTEPTTKTTAGTEAKTTESAGTEAKKTESAGTEAKTTESAGTEAKTTESAGTEAKTTESAGTEAKTTESAGTEAKTTESAGTEAKTTESAGTEAKTTESVGTEAKTTESEIDETEPTTTETTGGTDATTPEAPIDDTTTTEATQPEDSKDVDTKRQVKDSTTKGVNEKDIEDQLLDLISDQIHPKDNATSISKVTDNATAILYNGEDTEEEINDFNAGCKQYFTVTTESSTTTTESSTTTTARAGGGKPVQTYYNILLFLCSTIYAIIGI
ncbi:unnamed protein product [Owenia fusiformis]|uniref:Uncharacterized protein n=1 Tax=Owenia fusiformis TaxID=6347 RepID=A0A8J1U413_OWEFU|nr:unnamed protein product [Owenia fusiformis]